MANFDIRASFFPLSISGFVVPLVTAPNWYTWGIAWVQSLQCLILQRMKLTTVNRWRIVRPLRYLEKCLPTSCRRKWCCSYFFFIQILPVTIAQATYHLLTVPGSKQKCPVRCQGTAVSNSNIPTEATTKNFTKGAPQLKSAKSRLINHLWNAVTTTCVTKVIKTLAFFSILIFFLLLHVGSCSWVLLLHVAIRWSQVNFDQSVITITLSTKFFKWRYERMLTSVTVILLKKFATKNTQNLDIHDDNSMMNRFKCSRNARIISLPQFIRSQNPSLLRKITKLII